MVHNFFENALRAMMYDISLRSSPLNSVYKQTFPVAIMNTGDEVYMSNMFVDDPKQIYQRVPRMTFDIGGLTVNADQLTNPHTLGEFKDTVHSFKKARAANVRRMPIEFEMSAQVYFSNIFEFLQFTEVVLMNTYKNNIFPFYYLDKRHVGSYSYQDNLTGETNSTLGYDTDRRGRILSLAFTVELQYPAYDYYGVPENIDFDADGTGRGDALLPGKGSSLIDSGTVINSLLSRIHPYGRADIESSIKLHAPQEQST